MKGCNIVCAGLIVICLPGITCGGEPAVKADEPPAWVAAMKKVHADFKGTPGTFAQFGDSITVTMAFWAPLQGEPKKMSPEMSKALDAVKAYLKKDCWRDWKGPEYGSDGRKTIRWADENLDTWLKKLNPEVVLIMFGTNDLNDVPLAEYEKKTRSVVERCLKNGSVVILTTIPPRSGLADRAKQYADAQRAIAKDLQVPLIDYQAEILKRRPDDWDGSLAKFKDSPGDGYQVPTLISRDGVHPSIPSKFGDFSDESLSNNGYGLRSYLTLMTYADVLRKVLQTEK
jgi:lysophospholipase L1-like esterase